VELVRPLGWCQRISIGFPGVVRSGRVITAPNLGTEAWHGVKLGQPDWNHHSHSIAFSGELRKERILFYMILNAHREPLHFELPPLLNGSDNSWRRWIDTALDSPLDIVPWHAASSIPGYTYRAEARSVVVLFADLPGDQGERGR